MSDCVYCSKIIPLGQETIDHVIARGWYPEDTPPIQKWKAPACQACNNWLSRDEGDIQTRLALGLDPSSVRYGGIAKKAQRSFDPKAAKNALDAMHRFNKRQRMREDIMHNVSVNMPGALDAFTINYDRGSRTGIRIPSAGLESVVKKWIRGIHYCEIGQVVPANAVVDAHFVNQKVAQEAYADIEQFGALMEKGPAIRVKIWWVEEGDKMGGLYAFEIWEGFRAHGSVVLE